MCKLLLALVAGPLHAENTVLVFNPNRDMSAGERGEYSTPANIERYLKEKGFASYSLTLRLGARFGTDAEPTAHALEMAVIQKYSGDQLTSTMTGLNFNFSSDMPRSAFLGAGVGFGNRYLLLLSESSVSHWGYSPLAYLQLGKRFQITKSGSFSYTPTLTGYANGHGQFMGAIQPLSFSWNF